MENTITIREAITLIQEEAFAASGMTWYDVQAFYRSEKKRIGRFAANNPNYLRSREEIMKRDPSLGYIELDLPKRFDRPAPGLPYQHPYLYPWFEDILRYYNEKLEQSQSPLPRLIIATAPTGRFNAIALPGKEESGILIEDGLMNVANNYANELAFLFYEQVSEGRYQEREIEALKSYTATQEEVLIYLADVIWQYIIDGYSFLPGPIGATSQEDFSIRHILSQEFILFVLKHESFHIEWWRSNQLPARKLLNDRCKPLWDFYSIHLAEAFPEKLSREEFERIYYAQQEELLADFFAFSAVMKLGKKENTYTAAVKGGLLFFLIAELIQHLLFRLEDPDFIEKLHTLDGTILSLTAILARESHPYAFLRKCNILHMVKQVYPQEFDSIAREAAKMDLISEKIRELLDQKVTTATVKPFPHPKWAFGKSAML